MKKLKVAVFFGGKSPEHEVSIITAVQAMAALPDKFEVIPVYLSKTGELYTGSSLKKIETYQDLTKISERAERITLPPSPAKLELLSIKSAFYKKAAHPFDLIFPCFHGGVGEGGWIQGLAEYYGIPLVGTGLTGAVLGMDKISQKAICQSAGVPQAKYIWFTRSEWQKKATSLIESAQKLKYPLFVKPSRGGSSIGTTCAKNKTELIRSIDLATTLDTRIVVEEGITEAREINLSVMGNAGSSLLTSVCEEVFHRGGDLLKFEDKYLPGGKSQGMASTERILPAKIDSKLTSQIEGLAKKIFNLLDCAGLVRLDFLVKGSQIYFIEVNTIPGSLSFYLWEKSGYPYPKLLTHLIELALAQNSEAQKTLTDFASPILSAVNTGKLGRKLSH